MFVKELAENNNKIYEKTKRIKQLSANIDLNLEPEFLEDAKLYYELTSSLSVQAKAPLGEKFLCNKLGFTRIPANKNQGDAVDSNGYHYEFKNSFTNKQENLNMRQIRLWQNIDWYYCIYINEDNIEDSLFFALTKEEMIYEVAECGSATHGTVAANKDNTNIEYSITIPVYNDSNSKTKRWKERYLSDSLKRKVLGE